MDIDEFIESEEQIRLEAQAILWFPRAQVHYGGKAVLTDRRILWVGRSPWLSVIPFYKWSKTISIPYEEMTRIQLHAGFGRSWIDVDTIRQKYQLVVGEGPFPLIFRTPETSERWFRAIETGRASLRGDETHPEDSARPAQ